ncbi:BamA/TamA family outer membrane protein [candidate division WOR-3 bacterium]|nr:BamA/TamA family outer membrane protein [candidate division WOR-3 bacterium]
MAGTLGATVVSELSIEGLPRGLVAGPGFAAGETVSVLAFEAGREWLVEGLLDAGFLRAEVWLDTTRSGEAVAVRYVVRPGEPVLVGGWRFEGNESLAGAELARALPRTGRRCSRPVLEQATRAAWDAAAAEGYPLCRVSLARVDFERDRAFPVLAVDEGERVTVTRLEFEGAKTVSSVVLARSAGFSAGLVYSPRRVRSWRRNLDASGLVEVLDEELFRDGDEYGLRLAVQTRRAGRASGGASWSAASGQLSGRVELDLRNLLNTGRRLAARWQAYRGLAEYELSYTEPWPFGLPLELTGGARLRVVDTSKSRAGLDLAARLVPGPDVRLSFAVGYEQLAALDTTLGSRTTWAGTGVELDRRDRSGLATEGVALALATRVGERRRAGRSHVIGRVETDAEVAGPGWRNLTLDNRAHYRLVYSTDTLADDELVAVGGARTLRGYREEQFRALQAGWWSVELRHDFARDAAWYPFFDLGVLQARTGWFVRPGYGAGTRLGTRLGVFRLDYGLGQGDGPLEGRLHFGFEGGF